MNSGLLPWESGAKAGLMISIRMGALDQEIQVRKGVQSYPKGPI